jgi:hypothetical protein
MTLQDGFILWQHDLISHSALIDCAISWLSAGHDSPHLRILAGSLSDDRAELSPIVRETAKELNIMLPEGVDAYLLIARYYSRLILKNELKPIDGACKIWKECANNVMGDSPQEKEAWALLSPFIADADFWDELPSQRPEIEKDIKALARRLHEDT